MCQFHQQNFVQKTHALMLMKLTAGFRKKDHFLLYAKLHDVNFSNILQAAFAPISFCQKIKSKNCMQKQIAQNTFVQKVAFAPISFTPQKLQTQTVST